MARVATFSYAGVYLSLLGEVHKKEKFTKRESSQKGEGYKKGKGTTGGSLQQGGSQETLTGRIGYSLQGYSIQFTRGIVYS